MNFSTTFEITDIIDQTRVLADTWDKTFRSYFLISNNLDVWEKIGLAFFHTTKIIDNQYDRINFS